MTQTEQQGLIQRQKEIILEKEAQLKKTDYIAAKIAEGSATKSEYAEQISLRRQWRNEINEAETKLISLMEEIIEED